jgi:multicomponent Na+:H+ antiporter subunit D
VDSVPYTASHVVFYLQLLQFSGLAFFLMLGWLKRTLTITLDVDWFWRWLGPVLFRWLDKASDHVWTAIAGATGRAARGAARGVYRHHGPGGALARTWPTGNMAFWATVVLAASLILAYV